MTFTKNCAEICEGRKKWARHTVHRVSVDQPLDVRFRVSVGPTHKTAVLIRGQHKVGGFVQPIWSRCGGQGVGLAWWADTLTCLCKCRFPPHLWPGQRWSDVCCPGDCWPCTHTPLHPPLTHWWSSGSCYSSQTWLCVLAGLRPSWTTWWWVSDCAEGQMEDTCWCYCHSVHATEPLQLLITSEVQGIIMKSSLDPILQNQDKHSTWSSVDQFWIIVITRCRLTYFFFSFMFLHFAVFKYFKYIEISSYYLII